MTEPADGRPAWELEATREAVRRYRRAGRLWLAAGLLLFAGAITVAYRSDLRSQELEQNGARALGVVVDVPFGPPIGEGAIVVRFEAKGGVHARQINLNSESPLYDVGDKVQVIYDPHNLSNLRTTEEENDSGWAAAGMVLGFVGAVAAIPIGWTVGRRARRWKRMLRTTPWRQLHSTYKEVPVGRSMQPLLRLTENDRASVGLLLSSLKRRLGVLEGTSELWVVGGIAKQALVAPSPEGPVFEFRRSRVRRRQQKWERAFAESDAATAPRRRWGRSR